MLNVGPGLESDTGMTVLVVGPTEEPLAERLGVLEAGEGAFGRRLLYEPKLAHMTTLFRNSSDKRLVVFRGAFGGRPVKEGVTLTDDGRLRATFAFLGLDIPLGNVDRAHITPELSLVDGGRRPGLDEGRRAHVRYERERRCVPSRPGERCSHHSRRKRQSDASA